MHGRAGGAIPVKSRHIKLSFIVTVGAQRQKDKSAFIVNKSPDTARARIFRSNRLPANFCAVQRSGVVKHGRRWITQSGKWLDRSQAKNQAWTLGKGIPLGKIAPDLRDEVYLTALSLLNCLNWPICRF